MSKTFAVLEWSPLQWPDDSLYDNGALFQMSMKPEFENTDFINEQSRTIIISRNIFLIWVN